MNEFLYDNHSQFPHETMELNSSKIVIDPYAQRDVNRRQKQFREILKNFDPSLVKHIKVALVDGKYYCFDGQMTLKVLKERNNGKELNVTCEVYTGMTLFDAAKQFLKQDGYTAKVTQAEQIFVMKNYGLNGASEFVRIIESNGLYISSTGTQSKNAITAVSTMWKEYKSFKDTDDFNRLCKILKQSWDGDHVSLSSGMIRGIGMFIRVYGNDFDDQLLISHLSKKNPNEMLRDASADRSTGPRKYAVQIWLAYNFGLTQDKRLPNKL